MGSEISDGFFLCRYELGVQKTITFNHLFPDYKLRFFILITKYIYIVPIIFFLLEFYKEG